jgi:hypothetical protein
MGMKINQDCWAQIVGFVFIRVLMFATIFYQVSDVGFAYQSPPPYLTKAIS